LRTCEDKRRSQSGRREDAAEKEGKKNRVRQKVKLAGPGIASVDQKRERKPTGERRKGINGRGI